MQQETYLLELYRYIELNPVRADMVKDPADYSWSSYQCNALGKKTDLLTPHPLFMALGKTEKERMLSSGKRLREEKRGRPLGWRKKDREKLEE